MKVAHYQKFPHAFALALANKLVAALEPHVERILICGSLRRRKPMIGDIEIVYIPKIATEQNPESLFPDLLPVNLTDHPPDALELQLWRLSRKVSARKAQ